MENNVEPVRLNKYLSEIGHCSRRAADKLIESGRVYVNGEKVVMGQKVAPSDRIEIDGIPIESTNEKNVYLAFHKPVGIVCTTDTHVEKDNIIDFINYPTRIFPIGRLDKASEGLIFMTNDGDIVNKILRARNNHEKEYIVRVDKPISQTFVQRMSTGIPLEELGKTTKSCVVEKISTFEFKIILTQGLNRQIRRMCEYLDYRVIKLKRVRIMNIHLDLPIGQWRYLTTDEIAEIHSMVSDSAKAID